MSICVMPANGEPIIRLEVKEILQNDLQVNITSTVRRIDQAEQPFRACTRVRRVTVVQSVFLSIVRHKGI